MEVRGGGVSFGWMDGLLVKERVEVGYVDGWLGGGAGVGSLVMPANAITALREQSHNELHKGC